MRAPVFRSIDVAMPDMGFGRYRRGEEVTSISFGEEYDSNSAEHVRVKG